MRTYVGRDGGGCCGGIAAEKSGPRGHKRMTYGSRTIRRSCTVKKLGRASVFASRRDGIYAQAVIRYGTLHLVKAGVDACAARPGEVACSLEIGRQRSRARAASKIAPLSRESYEEARARARALCSHARSNISPIRILITRAFSSNAAALCGSRLALTLNATLASKARKPGDRTVAHLRSVECAVRERESMSLPSAHTPARARGRN